MILAAIDVGSNAVRLQITRVIEDGKVKSFKKVQYIRFPMRLGSDVFSTGKIASEKFNDFVLLMRTFKALIDLYKVDHYYACATSAMREAENGEDLVEAIKSDSGLELNIISGSFEAEIINKVISMYLHDDASLHIDVGGGSTELNVYRGREKIATRSFPLGTVRVLSNGDQKVTWSKMGEWIAKHLSYVNQVVAIGTGGNIRKLFELANGEKGKSISLKDLISTRGMLLDMSYEERMSQLQLNSDRADVIIPAADIYIKMMAEAGAKKILVPDIGLKDGIIAYLYEKHG
jgi:exopolyphosphatase/guanosine-5'-triphosphate,3'-diphosphate pyrophosphatase